MEIARRFFLKAMSPTDLKFASLNVDGKKATLLATGKSGGEMTYGTIDLVEENGQCGTRRGRSCPSPCRT